MTPDAEFKECRSHSLESDSQIPLLDSPYGMAEFQLAPRRLDEKRWLFSNRRLGASVPYFAIAIVLFAIAVCSSTILGPHRSLTVEVFFAISALIAAVIGTIRYGSYDRIILDESSRTYQVVQSRMWRRRNLSGAFDSVRIGACEAIMLGNINRKRHGVYLKAHDYLVLLLLSRQHFSVENFIQSMPFRLDQNTSPPEDDPPLVYVRGYSFLV